VVGAGDPEGFIALHAMPAGEDVHLGLVEHVAHVEAAGDVWRRQQDGKGLRGLRGLAVQAIAFGGLRSGFCGWLGEEVFADPEFGPFFFNGGGVVGFGEVVGHEVWSSIQAGPRGLNSVAGWAISLLRPTPHDSTGAGIYASDLLLALGGPISNALAFLSSVVD